MRLSFSKARLFLLALLLAFLSSSAPILAIQNSAFMRVYDLKAGHSKWVLANNNPVNYVDPEGLNPAAEAQLVKRAIATGNRDTIEFALETVVKQPGSKKMLRAALQRLQQGKKACKKPGKRKKSRNRRADKDPDDLDQTIENQDSLNNYKKRVDKLDDPDAFLKGANRTGTDTRNVLDRYLDFVNRGARGQ